MTQNNYGGSFEATVAIQQHPWLLRALRPQDQLRTLNGCGASAVHARIPEGSVQEARHGVRPFRTCRAVKRMFGHYEWLGPLLLTPAAGWLWLQVGDGNWAVMLVAVTLPVLHGYVVPAIGTNLLKVWSFSTRVRIGNFRPQHGFVFGSATAAIVALLFLALGNDAPAILRAGATGGVLLAVNWAYDALAIRHGACWSATSLGRTCGTVGHRS